MDSDVTHELSDSLSGATAINVCASDRRVHAAIGYALVVLRQA